MTVDGEDPSWRGRYWRCGTRAVRRAQQKLQGSIVRVVFTLFLYGHIICMHFISNLELAHRATTPSADVEDMEDDDEDDDAGEDLNKDQAVESAISYGSDGEL